MFICCVLLILGLLSVGVGLGIMNGWFVSNVPSKEDQGCLFMVFLGLGIICIVAAVERAYTLGL